MSIIELTVIALSIGIESMILTYRNTRPGSLRLTQGLMVSLILAIVYALLAVAGQAIGSLLRFGDVANPSEAYERVNTMVYLGLIIVVVLKKLIDMRKERRTEATTIYNLQNLTTTIALAAASGVDLLIIGMGIGFLPANHGYVATALPLIITTFLLAYIGVMFGRQSVVLRPARWHYMAIILLLVTAVYQGINM